MEDYIVYKLTKNACIDYSLAARTMAFDIRNKCWSDEILNAAGVDKALLSTPVKAFNIAGEITDELATLISSELIYLNAVSPNEKITMYINSPGGSVSAGLAIYDIMKTIKAPIETIGFGLCASMGAFILSSGDIRKAHENCEIMIHQPDK